MKYSDFEDLKLDDLVSATKGNLEVIGWSRRYSLKNIKLYVVRCSVCAKDTELFGDGLFEINKANFEAGRIPCGCSRGYKYSEEQAVLRIKRVMQGKPYLLKGFVGGYKDSSSQVIFECEKHGQWSRRTVASVCSSGTGCRACAAIERGNNLKLDETSLVKEVKGKVEAKGYIFHGLFGEYKSLTTRLILECPAHGVWDTTTIHKMKYESSRGCPDCGAERTRTSRIVPEPERLKQVEQICSSLGYKFNGWVGNFKNIFTKLKLECPEHGEWRTTDIRGFTENGVGCPSCRNKTADMSYIHLVKDGEIPVALKFGISVRPQERLLEQKRKTCFSMESLGVWLFPSREECWLAERECLTTLTCAILSKEEMPDGFRETTSVINLNSIISIFEKNGGIKR